MIEPAALSSAGCGGHSRTDLEEKAGSGVFCGCITGDHRDNRMLALPEPVTTVRRQPAGFCLAFMRTAMIRIADPEKTAPAKNVAVGPEACHK